MCVTSDIRKQFMSVVGGKHDRMIRAVGLKAVCFFIHLALLDSRIKKSYIGSSANSIFLVLFQDLISTEIMQVSITDPPLSWNLQAFWRFDYWAVIALPAGWTQGFRCPSKNQRKYSKPGNLAFGLRDKALLLLGYSKGMRRTELAAVRKDHIAGTEYGLQIRIPRSKSDQLGEGGTVDLIRSTMGWNQKHCPAESWNSHNQRVLLLS